MMPAIIRMKNSSGKPMLRILSVSTIMIIQKSYLQKNSVFDTLRNPLSITKKIDFSLTILENTKNLLFMEYIDLFDLCQL